MLIGSLCINSSKESINLNLIIFLSSKFIQDKYDGYSQKEAAYIAGAVYDSSLVLSASVGILIVSFCNLNLFLRCCMKQCKISR